MARIQQSRLDFPKPLLQNKASVLTPARAVYKNNAADDRVCFSSKQSPAQKAFLLQKIPAFIRFSSTFGVNILPPAPRDDTVIETLHGRPVADPFRPLEKLDDPATLAWAHAQDERTRAWLRPVEAERDATVKWHREIRDYVREWSTWQYGNNAFLWRQEGLAPQPVYLVRDTKTDAAPRVLLDPNTLSKDGTVAIQGTFPSQDGTWLAYTVSEAGSDMAALHVRDVATGEDIADKLTGLRHPSVSWDPDQKGFIYAIMVDQNGNPSPKGLRRGLFHHVLGQDQAEDTKVFEYPAIQKSWVSAFRLRPNNILFVTVGEGTYRENGLYFRKDGDTDFKEILPPKKASLNVFHRRKNVVYATTNLDAPRNRVVAINLDNPNPSQWRTIIPENKDPNKKLVSAFFTGTKLVVKWKKSGLDSLQVYTKAGKLVSKVPTPQNITLATGQVQTGLKEFLFSAENYLTPTTKYRYNVETGEMITYQKSAIQRDLSQIATVERVKALSRDGRTKVPMWIIRPKDLVKDGSAATLLYGYGGFNNADQNPSFSYDIMRWVEEGGVYVVANLRGDGAFGRQWYEDGIRANKQNTFDDFAACAEELIRQQYTSPKRLAISGASNGGLLTAVTMLQRPELFGAVISGVPVIDMTRFHQHGLGSYWTSDYGDPNKQQDFETFMKYSPLHNVASAKDVTYPPILITTADHDTRVAPWHAYKFAATLQQNGHINTFLRVEKRAGHGAGTPTEKIIQKTADKHAFLVRALGPIRQSAQTTA